MTHVMQATRKIINVILTHIIIALVNTLKLYPHQIWKCTYVHTLHKRLGQKLKTMQAVCGDYK